jgi:hypothetical protein
MAVYIGFKKLIQIGYVSYIKCSYQFSLITKKNLQIQENRIRKLNFSEESL